MGNQPSKDKGSKDGPDDFKSYPSFSRSDTRESTRSFRSLRSKIPGGSKSNNGNSTDSPRPSISGVNGNANSNGNGNGNGDEKSDAASVKSGKSNPSVTSRASRTDSVSSPSQSAVADLDSPIDDDQPPPSPVHHASSSGLHDVSAAQASGEVDHVSDQPPCASASLNTHLQAPGKSILVSSDAPIPIVKTPSADKNNSDENPGMSDINDIDLDDFIKRLLDAAYAGKVTKSVCLKNAEITAICQRAREVFLTQPSLLELDAPVKIVGDVHGQYTDLIRMFEMCGFPPSSNYLFLGDYVDRGKQSLETILLLLCYKLKFPNNFFLLRGNHECANVTRVYGFYDECKRRCNVKTWKTFIDCFNTLPIAAIVAGKIFCVHGGLSPALNHMDDIRGIARPTDIPDYGLLNDLVWADPAEMEADWEENERGVSYCFGKNVIEDFLAKHDFDLICRAHMVVEDGYEFFTDRLLVTVFSAPNVSLFFQVFPEFRNISFPTTC